MKKIISILFVILFVTKIYADYRQVPRFSITEEQTNLNRCFTVVNDFDTAMVFYMFADVRINTASGSFDVPLSRNIIELPTQSYRSQSTQGVLNDLNEFLTTESFYLPENTTSIEFFRQVATNWDPCAEHSGSNNDGFWGVPDRTDYSVELIKVSNDQLVLTLDSVTALPSTEDTNHWVGTNVALSYHIIPINVMTIGADEYYLRVKIKRFGPSPHGLQASDNYSYVNVSTLWSKYGDYISTEGETSYFDTLNTMFRSQLITHLDSIYTSSPNVFVSFPRYSPTGFRDEFMDRYFGPLQEYVTALGDTISAYWWSSPNEKRVSQNKLVSNSDDFRIEYVAPCIVSGSQQLYLKINSTRETELVIYVTDIQGQKLVDVYKGKIYAGNNTIFVNGLRLQSGTYFLNAISQGLNKVSSVKFLLIE